MGAVNVKEPPAGAIVNWPGYWFLLLDRYLAEGELEAAAEARRQLCRLGVEVRYRVRRPAERQLVEEEA
jgi:hypothetical protein